MTDGRFTREGATIDYRLTGSGRTFGYAHGVMLSREAVRRLGLFDVDSLANGRRLLTYDARGHGRSTGARSPGTTTSRTSARTCWRSWMPWISMSPWTSPDPPSDATRRCARRPLPRTASADWC